MIFDPNNVPMEGATPLAAEIIAEIQAVSSADAPLDGEKIREIARAVEHYVWENMPDGMVASHHLVLLSSRALAAVGAGLQARRLLLFGSGIVRPAVWEAVGQAMIWVVDLKQITLSTDACLELVFFEGLRIVIEAIAEVWDESGGSGVLGLRHVSLAAAGLVGPGGSRKTLAAVAREIKTVCRQILEHVAGERGWNTTPLVMNLDLREV